MEAERSLTVDQTDRASSHPGAVKPIPAPAENCRTGSGGPEIGRKNVARSVPADPALLDQRDDAGRDDAAYVGAPRRIQKASGNQGFAGLKTGFGAEIHELCTMNPDIEAE